MTPTQLRKANKHYNDMFGNDMDSDTTEVLKTVDDLDELDGLRDGLSDGEYDAAEAILENRQ